MLIDFTVKNFRSYYGEETLSMEAEPGLHLHREGHTKHIYSAKGHDLLTTKAIYGANASGKSNLIKALLAFFNIIQRSFKDSEIYHEVLQPFAFAAKDEPTSFQLTFFLSGKVLRYGFDAAKNADGKWQIDSEWLIEKRSGEEGEPEDHYYFIRENQQIDALNNKAFAEEVALITPKANENRKFRADALFLVAAERNVNSSTAKEILDYFKAQYQIIGGTVDRRLRFVLNSLIEKQDFKTFLLNLAQGAYIDITAIESTKEVLEGRAKEAIEALFNDTKEATSEDAGGPPLPLSHSILRTKRMGPEGQEASFSLEDGESEGTQKLISLSPFIYMALNEGRTFIVDEFDAQLHPDLSMALVSLFHDPGTNSKGAQLIFTTHDKSFLDRTFMRADQLCFVEREEDKASHLFNLADFDGYDQLTDYRQAYSDKALGAVPYINPRLMYIKATEKNELKP